MTLRRFISAVLLGATLFVSGCAQVQDLSNKLSEMAAERNRQTYAAQSDRVLATSFYSLAEGGKKEVLVPALSKTEYYLKAANPESLHFKRRWISQEPNWKFARDKMNTYSRSVLDDPVAQKYLEVTRDRGNVVRLYRPTLGSKINGLFKQYHQLEHDKSTQEWYGIDNMLIEYGKDGQVVSVLTKSYQGIATLGVSIDEYVHIYYGPSVARHVENNITNSMFSESYLRDLPAPQAAGAQVSKPDASAAPQAPAPRTNAAVLTASSSCAADGQLVRYTSIKVVNNGTRIDATVVKTGKKISSILSADIARLEMPKVGQFQCWDL